QAHIAIRGDALIVHDDGKPALMPLRIIVLPQHDVDAGPLEVLLFVEREDTAGYRKPEWARDENPHESMHLLLFGFLLLTRHACVWRMVPKVASTMGMTDATTVGDGLDNKKIKGHVVPLQSGEGVFGSMLCRLGVTQNLDARPMIAMTHVPLRTVARRAPGPWSKRVRARVRACGAHTALPE